MMRRRSLLTGGLGALAAGALGVPAHAHTPTPSGPGLAKATPRNPFDRLYRSTFRLRPLSADPIRPLARPKRAASLADAAIDPAYGTRIYRATSASDGRGRLRHEYSRRQAFNADNSRYLAQDGTGHWHLHDGNSFKYLGQVKGLGGDCEPIWHPTDPKLLYHTAPYGGMVWWRLNVATGKRDVVFDFTGKTPWPQARSFWTKGEGTTSADGRFLALMATRYDEATQRKTIYGLVMLDLVDRKIVGTLPASAFPKPHYYPDHISTSPSGSHAVVSWLYGQGGTVAYTRDFRSHRQLAASSEHSDLMIGADGKDYLIYADYSKGFLTAIPVAGGATTDLHKLYPVSGDAYALHVSGQAFGKPGWAVISTYADSSNYGRISPAAVLQPEYRKIWLLEVGGKGRKLNVAHIRADASKVKGQEYFLEPQASASRDLSRIIFASNFGTKDIESYIVGMPVNFAP